MSGCACGSSVWLMVSLGSVLEPQICQKSGCTAASLGWVAKTCLGFNAGSPLIGCMSHGDNIITILWTLVLPL